jgi:hypothetical protein
MQHYVARAREKIWCYSRDVTDSPASAFPALSEFQGQGLYQHHKGDYYLALFVGTHHETSEPIIAYVPYGHPESGVRFRELSSWIEKVKWPSGLLDFRFKKQ